MGKVKRYLMNSKLFWRSWLYSVLWCRAPIPWMGYQSLRNTATNKSFNVPKPRLTRSSIWARWTKMFTAVAIAQLAEAGEACVQRFNPANTYPDYPLLVTRWPSITCLHLEWETSLTEKFFKSSKGQFSLKPFCLVSGRTPIISSPGAQWQYSNALALLFLGAIIEQVVGQSYFDYVRTHLQISGHAWRLWAGPTHP